MLLFLILVRLYPNLEQILCECDEKEIPVLLDLAYLNIAIDLEIDLSHPCLEYVVSSLSKVFPVENHRIGIRLQKEMFEDPYMSLTSLIITILIC